MRSASKLKNVRYPRDLSSFIEHTLLTATATRHQIASLCDEAKTHNFRAVCVAPTNIVAAKLCLENSSVKIVTVVGFPLGSNTSKSKTFETIECIDLGADEIDVVINIGALKGGEYKYVLNDLLFVVKAANNKPVKVIIETSLLSHQEIITACQLSAEAGAQYIKTGTGFTNSPATADDVRRIKQVVDGRLKIKASGGIRSFEDAVTLLNAGADTLGTSHGVDIVTGKTTRNEGY